MADAEHRHTAMNAILAQDIRILGAGMAFIFNLLIAHQSGYFYWLFHSWYLLQVEIRILMCGASSY
jgi:hypothetical protein